MAALSTVLVFAVLGVVWRAGRRLALRATHRIPRDAQPLLEDTKFVICLALVGGFGLLLTLNPGLLVLPKDTTFTEQVARQAGLEALSCPTILDSKYMPGQGRYECEYVDAKGNAHDLTCCRIRRQGMALRPQRQTDEGDDEMNPEDNPMPLVSECNPVDAVECPCCLTVFRVRTLMTDGAGRLMRDEYETIPMFCPMCGGRLEQSERKE